MLIAFSTVSLSVKSQTLLKVFHGANGETQVYDNSDKQVSKPTIRLSQGHLSAPPNFGQ